MNVCRVDNHSSSRLSSRGIFVVSDLPRGDTTYMFIHGIFCRLRGKRTLRLVDGIQKGLMSDICKGHARCVVELILRAISTRDGKRTADFLVLFGHLYQHMTD